MKIIRNAVLRVLTVNMRIAGRGPWLMPRPIHGRPILATISKVAFDFFYLSSSVQLPDLPL